MSVKNTAPAKPDKNKKIIIGVICVILLLNIVWTVAQNKFTPMLESVKADMAKLEERIVKIENGGLSNVDDIRKEFQALKEVSDSFSKRLNDTLKTEQDQLAYLESQVEAQKARIEAIKKLAAPSAEMTSSDKPAE